MKTTTPPMMTKPLDLSKPTPASNNPRVMRDVFGREIGVWTGKVVAK